MDQRNAIRTSSGFKEDLQLGVYSLYKLLIYYLSNERSLMECNLFYGCLNEGKKYVRVEKVSIELNLGNTFEHTLQIMELKSMTDVLVPSIKHLLI